MGWSLCDIGFERLLFWTALANFRSAADAPNLPGLFSRQRLSLRNAIGRNRFWA